MEKKFTYFVSAVALVCLVNTGFKSTEIKETPAINFYGTVKSNGVVERAINITISGLYENIPVYDIPATADLAPTSAVTHINLAEVKALRHKHTKQAIKEYQKRDYIVLEIEFTGGKKKECLVERSRKLHYQVPFSTKVKPLDKEILFETLNEALIEGHKQRALKETAQIHPNDSAAKDAVCQKAREGLDALKEKMPNDTTGIVEETEKAVNYLCA